MVKFGHHRRAVCLDHPLEHHGRGADLICGQVL